MQYRTSAGGLPFPEGSIAMPAGAVLSVEIARGSPPGRSPTAGEEIAARTGGAPDGAAIGPAAPPRGRSRSRTVRVAAQG